MIDPGLRGRVALVTGCNRPEGIGAAIARALGAQGSAVAATGAPGDQVTDWTAPAAPRLAAAPQTDGPGGDPSGLTAHCVRSGCPQLRPAAAAARQYA